MKRMMHPLHGFHIVLTNAEEDAMKALGWSVAVPVTPPATPAPPALPAGPEPEAHTVDSVRTELDVLGIKYDKRWGLDRLLAAKG